MLSQEVIDALCEVLVKRVEEANTFTLKTIAEQLKKIGDQQDLRPTEINKLVNLLKYGGDLNKIKKKLAEMTKLNKRDIDKIFQNTAKKNQEFARQFYEYKNVEFIPLEENKALQSKVKAYAKITKDAMTNFSDTYGFSRLVNGKRVYTSLSKTYYQAIDRGILAISQGKETFNKELYRIIKELSSSGLKTVEYPSGYHRRLDSAVRMNLMDGLRTMTNEINMDFGREFDADGVEVDVHENPAPDHAEVQGHQFSTKPKIKGELSEFEKFQNDIDCHDVNGKFYSHEHDGHDRRSISQYNCYHNVFPIVIGVSNPIYSQRELNAIIKRNNDGFTYNGKHYTMYEGTQLQRNLETEIRKAKDQQIMARELGEDGLDLVKESQDRITKLTRKYNELVNISGLKSRKDRMRVSGYRRTSTRK